MRVITRTEGISVRVIRMLSQLVGFGFVEQLNVKFTKKYVFNVYCDPELLVNHQKVDSYHIKASIADSET